MAQVNTALLLLLLVGLSGASNVPFNYLQAGEDWKDTLQFPESECGGQSQSPINIETDNVEKFEEPIVAQFNNWGVVIDPEKQNVGQTLEVSFDASQYSIASDIQLPVKDGQIFGVLDGKSPTNGVSFVPALPLQFHFHISSENAIDGSTLPMEAHLVANVDQADVSTCPTTGCNVVFSTLFKIGDIPNGFISRIFEKIDVQAFENPVDISGPIGLRGLLPDDLKEYYYWNGSLTTPNCNENAVWILFKDQATVTQDQIAMLQKNFGLRRLSCQTDAGNDVNAVIECNNVGDLKNNRPVQPLNARKVFSSAKEDSSSSSEEDEVLFLLEDALGRRGIKPS